MGFRMTIIDRTSMNRSVVLTVLALALCATGVRAGGFAGGEPASYDATIYVDGAAAQGGDGSEAKPLASLRDGVARVQKSLKEGRSTKLLVKPGVYRESLPTIGCWMKGDDGSQNENVKFQDAWLRVDRWGDKGEVVISGAGGWWTVAGNPDLGQLTDPKQQPVDFSIWQAADGTWQLWSCIRNTKIGGRTRLFHRWEGKQLTDTDWKPMGIALRADLNVGEESVQSPYVFKDGGVYHMFYGDWNHICRATSQDGKNFTRVIGPDGKTGMFGEGTGNFARDPMVLKIGGTYHCYYCANPEGGKGAGKGVVFCRTSPDLKTWNESKRVAYGGSAGTNWTSAECPFVTVHDGWYYLFRTQSYGQGAQSRIYRSKDPLNFGINDDQFLLGTLPVAAPEIIEHEGQTYIASLLPSLKGIRIAKLDWGSTKEKR
jgi:hypothetical protein